MAKFQNEYALGRRLMPNCQGDEVNSVRLDFTFNPAGTLAADGTLKTVLALNDVIEMGALPAGHIPVDLVMVTDRLDTGATGFVAAGVINATDNGLDTAAANGGAAWIVATSVQAAGQTVTRATTAALWRCTSTDPGDRRIGLQVTAAPTTPALGTVSLIFSYRAANFGV